MAHESNLQKTRMFQWHHKAFKALNVDELYAILKLRQNVFVIEQQCIYPDIDDIDQLATHLFAVDEQSQNICAYLRILAPGIKFAPASIGRVLTLEEARGSGLGRQAMERAIATIEHERPNCAIKISAQVYLEPFYQTLNFRTISEPYDEDGIMHIDMQRG